MDQRKKKERRISGKYCVAGGPNQASCKNSSLSPGISMHYFPNDETLRQKWTRFVRRHRADFKPSKTSTLCSAHFEDQSFNTQSASIFTPEEIKIKRTLVKGSIPTVDTVEQRSTEELSARKRRQVSLSLSCWEVFEKVFVRSKFTPFPRWILVTQHIRNI